MVEAESISFVNVTSADFNSVSRFVMKLTYFYKAKVQKVPNVPQRMPQRTQILREAIMILKSANDLKKVCKLSIEVRTFG